MPVSVTALGSAQLERTHFQNLTDIAIRAPGVSLGANGVARGSAYSHIRGLGTASGNPDSQPAVGVIIDGGYLGGHASTHMGPLARKRAVLGQSVTRSVDPVG